MPAPPGQWTGPGARSMMGDWSIPMSPVKRTKAVAEPAPAKKTRTAPKAEAPEPKKAAKTVKSKASAKAEPIPQPEPAPPARKSKPEPAPKAAPKRKAAAAPAPAEPVLPPLAGALLQALQEGRAVELIFSDADANPPRTFEPRQLTFDTLAQSWFVWGWDRRYNAERHHRVDALAEVNPVEGVGRAAQGPYPEGTPSNQIGGWRGGEPIPVKAVLLKQWIFAVKQAPPAFPDFVLTDLEDGKAQVSFVGTDLRAIARWCMQFGDGLQVLEPQRLIDRIKQVGILWGGKPAAPPVPSSRTETRPEAKPEPKAEAKQEPKAEPKPESRRPEPRAKPEGRREEPRREREEPRKEKEEGRAKPGRVEIRIERL